jgi:hypothetical protein
VYHRLDCSLVKKYRNRRGREAQWAFGIYNIYAHRNPFYIDREVISLSDKPGAFMPTRAFVKYTVGSVFNFIPSVSYGVKF